MKFSLDKIVKCSHCGKELNFVAYPLISLQDLSEDEFNKLFELDLFKIQCDSCQKTTIVQYDTIIIDMFKKYLIFLCSSDAIQLLEKNEIIKKIINNEKDGKELYESLTTFRIVENLNDLLDKLLIFDYNLYDRIIECVKYQVETNLLKNNPTSFHYKLYFNKLEKTNLLFTVISENAQPMMLSVPIDSYNFFIDNTNISSIEKTKDFININRDWIIKNIKIRANRSND